MPNSTTSNKFSFLELGNQNGETLFFLNGFPDDGLSGWSPIFELLKKNYNIISLCIPQFEKGSTYKPWGYNFTELIEMLDNTINQLAPNTSITVVSHDWGAILTLLYCNKYPNKINRLVLVDVGIKGIKDSKSLWETFLILLYQWWFSIAYIISQFLGSAIGNCIFVLYMVLVTALPFLKVCPHDIFHRPANEMNIEMCYIYYQYWKLFFQGKPIEPKMPDCPILYIVSFLFLSFFFLIFVLFYLSMEQKRM